MDTFFNSGGNCKNINVPFQLLIL